MFCDFEMFSDKIYKYVLILLFFLCVCVMILIFIILLNYVCIYLKKIQVFDYKYINIKVEKLVYIDGFLYFIWYNSICDWKFFGF